MSKFEVIRGVEGCCLALDDTRIAGPKPWGGGSVIHAWETDKEYKAVDTHSRWYELFGTPERAAHTSWYMLWCKYVDCDECPISDGCDIATDVYCDDSKTALLEWLMRDGIPD